MCYRRTDEPYEVAFRTAIKKLKHSYAVASERDGLNVEFSAQPNHLRRYYSMI